MSGSGAKKRTHSGDLQPTPSQRNARIVVARRYPDIEVHGQIESGFIQTIWPLVNPYQSVCNECIYEINWLNRPLKLVSQHTLSAGDSDFLESTRTILKPLASLRYDKPTKLWVHKDAEQMKASEDKSQNGEFVEIALKPNTKGFCSMKRYHLKITDRNKQAVFHNLHAKRLATTYPVKSYGSSYRDEFEVG